MLKLFPVPKTIVYEDGVLEFGPEFFVEFSHEPDDEYNYGVKCLVETIKEHIGSKLVSKKGENTTVISFMLDETLEKEEYKIDVFDDEIVIRNSGYVSAFRAVTTLIQVIIQSKTKIPQFTLCDKPDMENRGVVIDAGRFDFLGIDELKRVVNFMTGLKYNQIHLYDENRVLGSEEIKEFSQYCKQRCIEIVPMCNCFGEDPQNIETIKKTFADVLPQYESDYINIGSETGKEADDILLEVYKLAEKYNKKIMFCGNKIFSEPDKIKNLPVDMILIVGETEDSFEMSDVSLKLLAKKGFEFFVCPKTSSTIDFGKKDGLCQNQLKYVEYAKKYGALGYVLAESEEDAARFTDEYNNSYIYGAGVAWGSEQNADTVFAQNYNNEYFSENGYINIFE